MTPIAARDIRVQDTSGREAWAAIARTYSGRDSRTGVSFPSGTRMAGPEVARTGLGEGEDTRGESLTVPHGDRGEHAPGRNTARRFGPEFGHGNVTVR